VNLKLLSFACNNGCFFLWLVTACMWQGQSGISSCYSSHVSPFYGITRI
jgi:hypothetical protein